MLHVRNNHGRKSYEKIYHGPVRRAHFEKNNFRKPGINILGIIGIVANLGILFYYKYFDFFMKHKDEFC